MASPSGAVGFALLLLTGCVEAVSLGTQCPSVTDCVAVGPGPGGDPGAPLVALDAGKEDSELPALVPVELPDGSFLVDDAGIVVVVPPTQLDGGATRGILPTLRNDSFELTRGSPGSIAYSPIDPVPLGLTLAEPWSACGFGNSVLTSADSVRGSDTNDVLPTNGPAFIEANLGAPAFQGIRQSLDAPLRRGVRYSFMIDVRAAAGADVTLEFWGSFVDCVGAMKFTDVGKVPEYWRSICVSFVPQSDFPELFLQPSLRSSDTNGDLRIFFDNIRADPSCL